MLCYLSVDIELVAQLVKSYRLADKSFYSKLMIAFFSFKTNIRRRNRTRHNNSKVNDSTNGIVTVTPLHGFTTVS